MIIEHAEPNIGRGVTTLMAVGDDDRSYDPGGQAAVNVIVLALVGYYGSGLILAPRLRKWAGLAGLLYGYYRYLR